MEKFKVCKILEIVEVYECIIKCEHIAQDFGQIATQNTKKKVPVRKKPTKKIAPEEKSHVGK